MELFTNSQINAVLTAIEKKIKPQPEDKRVHLMIKSWENYDNHKTNIFRDCLNSWSRSQLYSQSPFKFHTMLIDKDDIGTFHSDESLQHSRRIFFVNTTVGELQHYQLSHLIENEDVISNSYMSDWIDNGIYSQYREVA